MLAVKKIGHCCLVVSMDGKKILTDPGNYSMGQESETGITHVLITHEHADHLHMESLKAVLAGNRGATVLANGAVGALLEKEGIAYQKVQDGECAGGNTPTSMTGGIIPTTRAFSLGGGYTCPGMLLIIQRERFPSWPFRLPARG